MNYGTVTTLLLEVNDVAVATLFDVITFLYFPNSLTSFRKDSAI